MDRDVTPVVLVPHLVLSQPKRAIKASVVVSSVAQPRGCSPSHLVAQCREMLYTSAAGIAAVLEILAEPFYILASVHLMFKWVLGSRSYATCFGAGGIIWDHL